MLQVAKDVYNSDYQLLQGNKVNVANQTSSMDSFSRVLYDRHSSYIFISKGLDLYRGCRMFRPIRQLKDTNLYQPLGPTWRKSCTNIGFYFFWPSLLCRKASVSWRIAILRARSVYIDLDK